MLAIIYFVFVRSNARANDGQPPHYSGDSAMDILKRRYATGEISKEEFERMKADIL